MKKTQFFCMLIASVLLTVQNLAAQTGTQTAETKKEGSKVLTAYFSRADENYGVGFIEKGNTQIIAEIIAMQKNADIFHIQTVKPYPKNYIECSEAAKEEQNKKARPIRYAAGY